MAIIIYGSNLSPFVRKVRVALAEKGIAYELDQINPFAPPPEFLAISPLKRIPVMRDTDLSGHNTLPDSSIIIDYLEHKFPKPALYPADAFQRGSALWFEEYADSIVAQTVGGGLFFERVVKKLMRRETDEALCQKTLSETLPPLLTYLEREIGDRAFLVGDAFSIADISVASMFVNFLHAGETLDAAAWPQLTRYLRQIHDRPSFAPLIAEEDKIVQRVRAA